MTSKREDACTRRLSDSDILFQLSSECPHSFKFGEGGVEQRKACRRNVKNENKRPSSRQKATECPQLPTTVTRFLIYLLMFEKNALGSIHSIGHKVVTEFTVVLPLKSTSPLRLESRTSATLWTRGLSLSSGTERNSFTLIAPDLSRSNLWKRFSSLKFETSANEDRNKRAHGSFRTSLLDVDIIRTKD